MPRTPNLMGKFRKPGVDKPYLTVESEDAHGYGPTTFHVLKAYQVDPHKPYARVMVQAISGATGPSGDWGDAYWGDVIGTVTWRDPIVTDEMLPSHLREVGAPNVSTTLESVLDGFGLR